MTILAQIASERRVAAEKDRAEVRETLGNYLRKSIPKKMDVIVFGSLTQPGRFSRHSDIDLALGEPADEAFAEKVAVELEEIFERPVDVLLLSRTRLREAILRTGERWTL